MKKIIIFILTLLLVGCANFTVSNNLYNKILNVKAQYVQIRDKTVKHKDIFTEDELKELELFNSLVVKIILEIDKVNIEEIDIVKLKYLWDITKESYLKVRLIGITHLDEFDNKDELVNFDLAVIHIDNIMNEKTIDKVKTFKLMLDLVIFSIKIAKYLVVL